MLATVGFKTLDMFFTAVYYEQYDVNGEVSIAVLEGLTDVAEQSLFLMVLV